MKFHLTEEGPKRCTATVRNCPLGGEHFETMKDAEEAFASSFEGSGLASLGGNKDGKDSAEMSRQYAHWAVLNNHLHNSSRIGLPQELLYYSTAQGALELKRRMKSTYNDDYVEIAEKLKAGPVDFDYSLDQAAIDELAAEGKKFVMTDTSLLNDDISKLPRHVTPLRHYMAEESSKWLSRLTPEQQEAISWHTSNGFAVGQHAIGVEVEYVETVFRGFVDEPEKDYSTLDEDEWDMYSTDEDDNYEAAREKLEKSRLAYSTAYLATVNSALKLAPKLPEPVVIMRGTSLGELAELIERTDTDDAKSLMDSIEAGEFTGKAVPDDSRLKKLPLSASANPRIAAGFGFSSKGREFNEDRSVVLAIKGRSFASPVNVSAWGTGEYEVLTNPNSNYKITGGRRVSDDKFILELEEVGE